MFQDIKKETPWAVVCQEGHGKVCLTKEQYDRQMNRPDSLWYCPLDGCCAYWDDEHYEKHCYPDDDGRIL